jgi:hypothetical protein
MEKKIDIPDFCIAFCERHKLNEEVLYILESNLILSAPHIKSVKFSGFMEDILNCCEAYEGDPEPFRTIYDIDDTEFQDLVEKTYFQLQKFLEK